MRFLLFALIALAGCAGARPAPAPEVRPFDHTRRIEMISPVGIATSHDGARILFTADANGTLNAFTASLSDNTAQPVALTQGVEADTTALSYFPGDDRVLLSVGAHLVVRALEGTQRDLGALEFLGWRADGLYAADRNGIYAFASADLERRTLYSSAGVDAAVVSRDGHWLAVRSGDRLSLVDLTGANAVRTVAADEAGQHALFEFSGTSRSLVYGVKAPGGFMQARRYTLATGEITPVMEAQADVMSVTSSPSGRYTVYVTGRNGTIEDVAVIDQQTDRALPLAREIRDVRFNRDESKVFFRLSNDNWPQDIFVSDLDGTHLTRLVHAFAR